MLIYDNLNINENGHLAIGGVDTVDLANEFKTPLYVMDVNLIRKNCKIFKNAIKKYYEDKGIISFASKAFCCKAIYRVMKEEKMYVDTVSIGEMYTAICAGVDGKHIYLHGNNKTREELTFAVENNIGGIVVDNLTELENLNKIAQQTNKVVDIFLRIKPGVDAHVHEYVTTGKDDSKFGFAIENNDAIKAVEKAIDFENINLIGLHCHIGSQILVSQPFVLAAEKMIDFIKIIKDEFNFEILELNLGGGFGVRYTTEEIDLDVDQSIKTIVEVIKRRFGELNLKLPRLILEPGRSIVAKAGITLYTVGNRKENSNGKIYISVDGGMTDNPRYILYKSVYEAIVANKAFEKRDEKVSIAGKCCESGDLIGENMLLQHAVKDDIIAVLCTGAYNFSMMSNYNRNLNPAVVFVENGESKLVVKRQTLKDLIRNDI